MKNFLLALMFLLLPVTAQAVEGITYHETNDAYLLAYYPDVFVDTSGEVEIFNYVSATYEFNDGTKCKVLLVKWYNESRHKIGSIICGSTEDTGDSEPTRHNGATVDINRGN